MLSMLFHYFAIVSSWNLNNVDFSSPKNVFYLICLVLEKKMFSVINAFSQFCYNLPLEKVVAFNLERRLLTPGCFLRNLVGSEGDEKGKSLQSDGSTE